MLDPTFGRASNTPNPTLPCPWGWPSPKPCNYTGGCYCERENGHAGRCRCVCGSTSQRKHGIDGSSDEEHAVYHENYGDPDPLDNDGGVEVPDGN